VPRGNDSGIFRLINILNFVHHVAHANDGDHLHQESGEYGVGVHPHTSGTDSSASEEAGVDFLQMLLGFR